VDKAALDPAALEALQRRRQALGEALRARSTPVTFGLLVVIGLFFLAMGLCGGSTEGAVLLRFGALATPLVRQGQWWRLVAAAFLHIGWAHLLFNGGAIYFYGRLVEQLYGPLRFLGIYLIAAVLGDLVSVFLVQGVSAGASGALFGLFGATIAMLVRYRRRVPPAIRQPLLQNALVVVGLNALFSLAIPGINLYAHAGGLLGGVACGALFRPRPLVSGRPQPLLGAAIGFLVALVSALGLLLAVLAAAAPSP
jgi:rhomboid protease GluP